jgi:hypothetical protein
VQDLKLLSDICRKRVPKKVIHKGVTCIVEVESARQLGLGSKASKEMIPWGVLGERRAFLCPTDERLVLLAWNSHGLVR